MGVWTKKMRRKPGSLIESKKTRGTQGQPTFAGATGLPPKGGKKGEPYNNCKGAREHPSSKTTKGMGGNYRVSDQKKNRKEKGTEWMVGPKKKGGGRVPLFYGGTQNHRK